MSFAANGTEVWKYIARGRLLLVCHQAAPPASITTKNRVANSQLARSNLLWPAERRPSIPACEAVSPIHLSSLAKSLALCHRSSGSFARHFLTAWSSAGGVIGFTTLIGSGSLSKIADATLN
jgi:hypothetical protein